MANMSLQIAADSKISRYGLQFPTDDLETGKKRSSIFHELFFQSGEPAQTALSIFRFPSQKIPNSYD
jgi:hypothetical protein